MSLIHSSLFLSLLTFISMRLVKYPCMGKKKISKPEAEEILNLAEKHLESSSIIQKLHLLWLHLLLPMLELGCQGCFQAFRVLQVFFVTADICHWLFLWPGQSLAGSAEICSVPP